jgi:hypothetical protein
MNDSILNSIKKLLGISEDYTYFDMDIIMHINTVISILFQLGIGDGTFVLSDSTQVWSEYVEESNLELIKTYIYLKVKTYFDPGTNSGLLESLNRQIAELEWRINVAVDPTMR